MDELIDNFKEAFFRALDYGKPECLQMELDIDGEKRKVVVMICTLDKEIAP